MRIYFVSTLGVPFHAHTINERPIGGTETGVIYLAEALHKLGHEIAVFTNVENPPLSSPLYLPLKALYEVRDVDILIAIRDWAPLLLPLNAKRRVLWTGDSYDQPQNVGIGDKRVTKAIDEIFTVSRWHAETLSKASGYPREKMWPLGNGVNLDLFEGKEVRARKRLIYSSTPYRGLALLPEIFTEVRKLHPDAELHIFSGFSVYSDSGNGHPLEPQFQPLFDSLKALPGCTVHGNVPQKELAREFMKSAILAYPNTFEETSCITVLEAQAAGCVTVTSAKGALMESVGDSGVLISSQPGSPEYRDEFTQSLLSLLSDDALFSEYQAIGLKRAPQFSWKKIAERLDAHLRNLRPN